MVKLFLTNLTKKTTNYFVVHLNSERFAKVTNIVSCKMYQTFHKIFKIKL